MACLSGSGKTRFLSSLGFFWFQVKSEILFKTLNLTVRPCGLMEWKSNMLTVKKKIKTI
jgi:hypothetical protein